MYVEDELPILPVDGEEEIQQLHEAVTLRSYRLGKVVVTAIASVAVVCAVVVSQAKKSPRSQSAVTDAEALFLEHPKHASKVDWQCTTVSGVQVENSKTMTSVWGQCSKKWEEDCSETGCCVDEGMTCFRKNDGWSTCKASCQEHDKSDNDTWSCDVVYPPTPRTSEGCLTECRKSKCKQAVFSTDEQGRCHLSDKRHTQVNWAADNVNSTFCGSSSEQKHIEDAVAEVSEQLPFQTDYPLVNCSWSGEDCSQTKCCNNHMCDEDFTKCWDYSCLKKDEYFSGCLESAPEDWDGTWLGGTREFRALPPAGANVAVQGTSLYCFTVVTWDAPRPKPFWNSEAELANNWKQHGLHVLQCDGSDILDGLKTEVAEWGSFSNIDMFMEIWKKVGEMGKWREHDWTVKVDSDAVFLPDRLKQHLEYLRTPRGARVYVENIDFKFKYMGAIEIMSKDALALFLDQGHTCINGKHDGGEDSFLKGCLDGLGIDHQSDYKILRDKYAALNPPCVDGWAVAYHYMKKMHDWSACYNEAVCGGSAEPDACDLAIPVPKEISEDEINMMTIRK